MIVRQFGLCVVNGDFSEAEQIIAQAPNAADRAREASFRGAHIDYMRTLLRDVTNALEGKPLLKVGKGKDGAAGKGNWKDSRINLSAQGGHGSKSGSRAGSSSGSRPTSAADSNSLEVKKKRAQRSWTDQMLK